MNDSDRVRARRTRIARVVRHAQRAGYAALAIAVVSFVVAAATNFPAAAVDISIAALVAAIVILPVPIVLGYGIRAAEREERGGGGFADRRRKAGACDGDNEG